MKTHFLNIGVDNALVIYQGIKTFELRYNDRDFKIGDKIRFKINSFSYSEVEKWFKEFEARTYLITHIVNDYYTGVLSGWVGLSIKFQEKS